jgi:hypothetical protein
MYAGGINFPFIRPHDKWILLHTLSGEARKGAEEVFVRRGMAPRRDIYVPGREALYVIL